MKTIYVILFTLLIASCTSTKSTRLYTNALEAKVRESPNVNAKVLGVFDNNTLVTVLEKTNNEWTKISVNDLIGYLPNIHLKKKLYTPTYSGSTYSSVSSS